jgi:hypothetical protein
VIILLTSYIHKPTKVEAFHLKDFKTQTVIDCLVLVGTIKANDSDTLKLGVVRAHQLLKCIKVRTKHCTYSAYEGDYIIKDSRDGLYVMRQEEFESLYNKVPVQLQPTALEIPIDIFKYVRRELNETGTSVKTNMKK